MAISGFSATAQIIYELTTTPAVVSALTVADQTFTVPGLRTNMTVVVNPTALTTNLSMSHAWVSAANTLSIRFVNLTQSDITPVSQTFKVVAL